MSVIPLIYDGDRRTVVTRPEDFDHRRGLKEDVIMIQYLETEQKDSQTETNVSYDLRVGREFRDHRDRDRKKLDEGRKIRILPGRAVIIETEEFVRLPNSVFGQIVPKVSLLGLGIANTPSKVDPGYHGHLLITVFNHGRRTVDLRRRQRFCALFLLTVQDGVRPYQNGPKRIEAETQQGSWRRVRDWITENSAIILVILAVFTLIAVIT